MNAMKCFSNAQVFILFILASFSEEKKWLSLRIYTNGRILTSPFTVFCLSCVIYAFVVIHLRIFIRWNFFIKLIKD